MADDPRWLTDDEQRAWRSYVFGAQQIDAALDRQLQQTLVVDPLQVAVAVRQDDGGVLPAVLRGRRRGGPARPGR